MKKLGVFICGGHFSPAIAIIEELKKLNSISLFYIGRKYSLEGDKAISLEFREITKLKIPFLVLNSGRLARYFSLNAFVSLIKIPYGFYQSLSYIIQYKPKLIVAFGSYISLPVCLSALLFRIPIIIHEQTRIMGLANRIISLWAKSVCLSFTDTNNVPRFVNSITTGNPLRDSIIHPSDSGITRFGNLSFPLIYITGGSQGSASINGIVEKLIPRLINSYRILHVTGSSRNYEDFKRLSQMLSGIFGKLRENYLLMSTLDYQKIGEVLKNSDLVIGRSGANTIAEISYWRKYAILIPLPWSAQNEQYHNALQLEKSGLVTIITQNRLKPGLLISSINGILKDKDTGNRSTIGLLEKRGKERLVGLIQEHIKSAAEDE